MRVIANVKIGSMRTEEEGTGFVKMSHSLLDEGDLVSGAGFPNYIEKIDYYSKESLQLCRHPL